MESKGERFAQGVMVVLEILKNILVIIVCLLLIIGLVLGWAWLHNMAEQFDQMGATVGDISTMYGGQ